MLRWIPLLVYCYYYHLMMCFTVFAHCFGYISLAKSGVHTFLCVGVWESFNQTKINNPNQCNLWRIELCVKERADDLRAQSSVHFCSSQRKQPGPSGTPWPRHRLWSWRLSSTCSSVQRPGSTWHTRRVYFQETQVGRQHTLARRRRDTAVVGGHGQREEGNCAPRNMLRIH